MTLFLAVFIPIAILGFLYLFIIENNGLPDWMARASQNSSSIWTLELSLLLFSRLLDV